MGWLPCYGKSNSRAKKNKKMEQMPIDQIRPTSGKAFFLNVKVKKTSFNFFFLFHFNHAVTGRKGLLC